MFSGGSKLLSSIVCIHRSPISRPTDLSRTLNKIYHCDAMLASLNDIFGFLSKLFSQNTLNQLCNLAQSTSTPFSLSSDFAISISPISSAYASGTSLNVMTLYPSLKRRNAPNDTIAQKGSWTALVSLPMPHTITRANVRLE